MSGAHTEGPWHWVNPETDQPRQKGEWRASLRTVAEVGENKTEEIDGKFYTRFALPKFIVEADEIRDENMEANARLIAAAPDLLEALEGLVAIIQKAGLSQLARGVELGQTSWAVKASDRMEAAHRAVAKATTAVEPNSVGTPQGVNQND